MPDNPFSFPPGGLRPAASAVTLLCLGPLACGDSAEKTAGCPPPAQGVPTVVTRAGDELAWAGVRVWALSFGALDEPRVVAYRLVVE